MCMPFIFRCTPFTPFLCFERAWEQVDISANTYPRADLVKCEGEVCSALGFRLSGVTCAPFLQHFLSVADANPKQVALAWYLAELGLLDYHLVGVPAAEYAAAAVLLARQTLMPQNAPPAGPSAATAVWPDALRHYARAAPSELAATATLLHGCQVRAWDGAYAAVRNKYARADKFHVSDFVACLPSDALRFLDA